MTRLAYGMWIRAENCRQTAQKGAAQCRRQKVSCVRQDPGRSWATLRLCTLGMSLRKRSERYLWVQAFLGATGEIPWEGMACPMQCNLKNPPFLHSYCLISMSACQATWNTRKGAFVGPAGKNWFHHTTFLACGSYWCTGLITGIYWMLH